MRKILIMLCLALGLVGCGKPSTVSEDVYNLGLKAVEVTEQFLSADLTADEAKEKLKEIDSRTVEDSDYRNDSLIKSEISLIATLVSSVKDKPEEEEIKEIKDYLKKLKDNL